MKPEQEVQAQVHNGHRRRMLESFLRTGLAGFSDVEALEFLLSYSIPRQDVNPLAHRLLEEFGGLHRIFELPASQLSRVPGVGSRTAALIRLVAELWVRGEESRSRSKRYLRSTEELGKYLCTLAEGTREERAWLLSLDASCRVLECRELCRGAVNAVNLPFRKRVEAALLANASSVVLAHNHTNGNLLPSLSDISYTRDAARALALVDVILADHFIIGERRYLSLRAGGMLEPK